MTAWCHLPTIFNQRRALRIVGLLLLFIALITTLLFARTSHAAPGTNKTINFQGRLTYPTGGAVADGYYNIQFKIYQDGTGTTAGNTPDGVLKWTESYTNNNGTAGIQVKGGYFTVNLGSQTAFGDLVDWDQDTLWLSMNVAGSSTACTTFGSGSCPADGEMLPMQRMTAVPYALNAGALQGKTAENFIQLAQGVQTDSSNDTSSVFVNRTGFNGNFLQLQNSGVDMFTLNDQGDIVLGSAVDHEIKVATSATDTAGSYLALIAGSGGDGSGANGGDFRLQGGSAGGTNGNGGAIQIDAGAGTGSGVDGIITIGTTHASNILIGSTYRDITQNILIGANDTAGNSTNVIIGNGAAADSGNTTLRAKEAITLETNGTTRATFAGDANAVYFGNGVAASAPDDFTLQGTNSSAANVAGGSLTVQGGNATTGNANGGNVTLAGGSGSGSGADGLVVLTTPTFSTVANDANCFTGGVSVASSCTLAASTVNSASAAIIGFSTSSQTASIPNPTITTAGRILYIMAAGDSQDFTLAMNGGGAGNTITMRKNTAATLLWNGSDWVSASASNTTTLQDAYNNTPQAANGDELILNNTTGNLSIRDSSTDPINGSLLEVKNSSSNSLFSVNSSVPSGLAANPGAETAGASSTTFPANTWSAGSGDVTVTRQATAGNYIATGNGSVKVVTNSAQSAGTFNHLTTALTPSTVYNLSLSARLESGTMTDLGVIYSPDGIGNPISCTGNVTLSTTEWKKVSCSFTTPASGVTSSNLLVIGQGGAGAHTFYLDNLTLAPAGSTGPSVQIGGGATGGAATLFTLDKSATPPTAATNDALLGSMYYDTTAGKVQCFEADGWGTCSAQPDTFVTLSPQYANAVTNTSGIGTMSTDLCSGALNINDGSSSQPTICSESETYNFYKWTTNQGTPQTRSIFVTYQLPSNFKGFVAGSTSLMARSDHASDSLTTYSIFRNRNGTGLTNCGSAITASGTANTWSKAIASGGNDPSGCGFIAGDNILIRIDLATRNSHEAYISNLNFAFSNN